MEKDTIDRMTTRIGPNCRLGTVQTSSFRYHEHYFLEYMGSVDNCRLNDFLDSIPLSYFDEYFRHRDERYVDDVSNEDEAQLALNISAVIPIDTYIMLSKSSLESLVGKICYCFDKNGGLFRGTIQKVDATFEAPKTEHGFNYNRSARQVHITYHVNVDGAHPEIVCNSVYYSELDAVKAMSEQRTNVKD